MQLARAASCTPSARKSPSCSTLPKPAANYTLTTSITPPGGGPPPHWHENEDELLGVLAGRVSFLADGKWTETAPCTAVFAPCKSVHTFKNVGDQPSKLLVHITPSGFENFFAADFARPGGPNLPRVVEIAAQ